MKTKRPADTKSRNQNDQIKKAKMQVKRARTWKPVQAIIQAVNRKKPQNVDEELFFQRMKISRRLTDIDRKRIMAAVEATDGKFLLRLAKIFLQRKKSPLKPFSEFEKYLQKRWRRLYKFSDKQLLDAFRRWCEKQVPKRSSNMVSSDYDSIKKIRQRLGFYS